MLLEIVVGLIVLLVFYYFYITKDYGKFEAMGIKEATPMFPFGSSSTWKIFTLRLGMLRGNDVYYNDIPEDGNKVLVTWTFNEHTYVIKDLELIKSIFIKDFDHFVDRRVMDLHEETNKYALNMLTMLNGDKWKTIRSIVSPIFTSGKLKHMTSNIHRVNVKMIEYLKQRENQEFEMKEMMVKYALSAISSCAIGIETNPFKEGGGSPEYEKIAQVTGAGKPKMSQVIVILTIVLMPKVAKFFKCSLFAPEGISYFSNLIRETMKYRKENNRRRNDLIDSLLKEMEQVNNKSVEKSVDKEEEEDNTIFDIDAKIKNMPKLLRAFTNEELETALISTGFVVYAAGFDTTSTMLSGVLGTLALHPEIQEKLYIEISQAINDNNGSENLDYHKVMDMKYLDMVLMEALRIYSLTFMERQCVKDYKLPGTNVTIRKGENISVPSGALMKDPKYFPNPEVFNPENFSPENKTERSPYTFLSYGLGPRHCVGMRFANLQMKMALIHLISNFKIRDSEENPIRWPYVMDPKSAITATITGGIHVKFEKRIE